MVPADSAEAVKWSAHGAIYKVAKGTGLATPALEAFKDIVGRPLDEFNNAPNMTRKAVALAMKRVARSLEMATQN